MQSARASQFKTLPCFAFGTKRPTAATPSRVVVDEPAGRAEKNTLTFTLMGNSSHSTCVLCACVCVCNMRVR